MHEDFLPLVAKPARYINSEVNAVRKDLAAVTTKVCLFFPDVYEVGMSHLGLRILYDILNKRQDTACERVFSPWTDYEERLRAAGRPLTSLESDLPLSEFDIVGISLQYELSYTNILNGLELGRIPLRSRDRTDDHPVIIAGGPCAVNPEPLADFMDAFFVGEAEEAVHEIVDMRQNNPGRREFLEAIAQRDGFYVPALGRSTVKRRYLKDLNAAAYPDRPLLPLMKPVHDRVTVEVARGCIRGCRFCQAGIIYRPFRERSPERVKNILRHSLACTGYEELSLAALSSGDYSSIEPLILELMETYRDSRVSVSLPSLRVGTLTQPMIQAIASTRKTGFTLAPEAGTERLRSVINKPVSDLDLMETAETVFANGWSVLKLYFMIGLPTETDEDLDGIIRLGRELLARGRRVSKRRVQINIGVSTFVPKPHTPFQWIGQAPLAEIRRKQAYLRQGMPARGISLRLHDPETSLLEAVFARGDRGLGRVIEQAVRTGCRFDGWSECFDFGKWESAFRECGLEAAGLAEQAFDPDAALPWDHIHTGVAKKFLQQEFALATAAEITENCRTDCSHCGIGCTDGGTASLGRAPGTAAAAPVAGPKPSAAPAEASIRIRMKYSKTGRVRFLSHLDFMTLFHRTVMRARVPVAFSQGFNPHPKISFGPALPVGIESEAEYLDIETDPFVDQAELVRDLNAALPDGVRMLECRTVPKNAPSLSGCITRYGYRVDVPALWRPGVRDRVERLLSEESVIAARDDRARNIRPCIETIRAEGDEAVHMILQDCSGIKPRVQDVVAVLFQAPPGEPALFRIKRTGMYVRDGRGTWSDPISL